MLIPRCAGISMPQGAFRDHCAVRCGEMQSCVGCCRIQQQDDWTRVLPGFKGKEVAKQEKPQEASL